MFWEENLEATVGFEPTHRDFADPRLNHLATSPPKILYHGSKDVQERDQVLS